MLKRHQVQFYMKQGCPLCDEAREVLHRLQGRFSITIQETDITTDSVLHERYKTIVPVLIIDRQFTLGARIEEDELRSYLLEVGDSDHT